MRSWRLFGPRAGPAGALLIVKNYTGDRLNFGLAAELATAEGIPTRMVIVADDVALHDTVERSHWRGIAGTVLVHKVAGAAAAAGLSLDNVAAEAAAAAASVGTMGVSLGACTVPAAGVPGFSLGEDEMELGLGIHGEQGVRRTKLEAADAVTDTIISTLVTQMGIQGGRVALLVNGLGGTPPMELAIVARRALAALRGRGIRVDRAWAGNFMTALEMPGCSLSLMVLDDARVVRLDAAVAAPAWPGGGAIAERRVIPDPGRRTRDATFCRGIRRWCKGAPCGDGGGGGLRRRGNDADGSRQPGRRRRPGCQHGCAGRRPFGPCRMAPGTTLRLHSRPWATPCGGRSPAVPARSMPPPCCGRRVNWVPRRSRPWPGAGLRSGGGERRRTGRGEAG